MFILAEKEYCILLNQSQAEIPTDSCLYVCNALKSQ